MYTETISRQPSPPPPWYLPAGSPNFPPRKIWCSWQRSPPAFRHAGIPSPPSPPRPWYGPATSPPPCPPWYGPAHTHVSFLYVKVPSDFMKLVPPQFLPHAMRGKANYSLNASCGSRMTVRVSVEQLHCQRSCTGGEIPRPQTISISKYSSISAAFDAAAAKCCSCPLTVWSAKNAK